MFILFFNYANITLASAHFTKSKTILYLMKIDCVIQDRYYEDLMR